MMFTHLTVGTNDLVKAHAFYNLVLPTLGYVCLASMENSAVWGGADSRFVVLKPTDGNVATVGNGVTIGFTAPTRAAVDEFHKVALQAGGVDAGAPGPRNYGPHVYSAYVRDLDGHKIVATCLNLE
ncbi:MULTISPECIES: VOC family protein [Pseudomonas]|jgi:predicted lactoylglutathione lyase|uniref:VOC family protein n=1 Tax=Pseudomonas TaxID=286 RepID=UPI00078D284D|nr:MULTISPECIES: VOC family protein [Pseudomonas]AMO77617.1 Glyoxalase-like domain protein [Pseudomonas citronellolis]PWU31126.1 VOC family protein [Pseudomonas sp. RW407]QOF85799.1 VOC family protein [Pseudomonas sp. ADPe]WRT80806.1 VOC family protein [Pseudomonas citronellolis]